MGIKINNKRWQLFEIDQYLTDIEKRNDFSLVDSTIKPISVKQTSRKRNRSVSNRSRETAADKKITKVVHAH